MKAFNATLRPGQTDFFIGADLPGVGYMLNFFRWEPDEEPRRHDRPRRRSRRVRGEEPRGVLQETRSQGHHAHAAVSQGAGAEQHRDARSSPIRGERPSSSLRVWTRCPDDLGLRRLQRNRTTIPAVNSACQTTSALIASRQAPGRHAVKRPSASMKVANTRLSKRNPKVRQRKQLDPAAGAEPEADLAVAFSGIAGQTDQASQKRPTFPSLNSCRPPPCQ